MLPKWTIYDERLPSVPYKPTGRLKISINEVPYDSKIRHTWPDGAIQRLENCLGAFVAGLHKSRPWRSRSMAKNVCGGNVIGTKGRNERKRNGDDKPNSTAKPKSFPKPLMPGKRAIAFVISRWRSLRLVKARTVREITSATSAHRAISAGVRCTIAFQILCAPANSGSLARINSPWNLPQSAEEFLDWNRNAR